MTNLYRHSVACGFTKRNGPLAAHAVPLPGRGTVLGRVLGNVMPPAASALPVLKGTSMFKGTILLVSDDRSSSMASRLESAGWAVLSAYVREALAVLFINRSIDAVVLNPGNSAADCLVLARGLRALRPDVPIFLVTTAVETAKQASSIEHCFPVSADPEQVASQVQSTILRAAV